MSRLQRGLSKTYLECLNLNLECLDLTFACLELTFARVKLTFACPDLTMECVDLIPGLRIPGESGHSFRRKTGQ